MKHIFLKTPELKKVCHARQQFFNTGPGNSVGFNDVFFSQHLQRKLVLASSLASPTSSQIPQSSKMVFVTLITIFASISFVKSENNSSIQCIVNYLRDEKVLMLANFEHHPNENCDNLMRNITITFNNDIITQLQVEDNKTCINELFKQYRIFDVYLKGLLYHSFNLTRVADFVKEASETTNDILQAMKSLCSAEERYGKIFNESLDSRHENVDDIVDSSTLLCVKKYYIDNLIIDPCEFNIDVPAIHASNCEEIVKELDDSASHGLGIDETSTLYGLPSVEVQNCNNKKFIDEKVLLKLASFDVATKLDLTEVQESKLRNDYVKWMTANVRFLLECIEKLME